MNVGLMTKRTDNSERARRALCQRKKELTDLSDVPLREQTWQHQDRVGRLRRRALRDVRRCLRRAGGLPVNAVIASCLMVVTLLLYGFLALRPVTIDLSTHHAFEPAFVRVTVRVEPNPDNRNLRVEADGLSYRSSDIGLEGETAPLVHRIEWRAMPAGEYAVRALVTDSAQKIIARDATTLKVIGRDE